jgi:alkylated DNA repair protein (DNA oxidative demethylase)
MSLEAVRGGLRYFPALLDRPAQEQLVAELRQLIAEAPFFVPTMPRTGRPFTVRMTNLGSLGWVSDRQGYRYQSFHPSTGRPWPPIPAAVMAVWKAVSACPAPPEACLVNHYRQGARMGLHQDADEQEFSAPVVSLSLGDTAVFRIGGTARWAASRTFRLLSGDVLVLAGDSRLAFHGVDRILAGSSTLLHEGGRLNLTLRRVNPLPLNR